MVSITDKNSKIGIMSRDCDPRLHKDWFFTHLDEIQKNIDSMELSPLEEMIKLNEDLNIDVDFERILRNNIED